MTRIANHMSTQRLLYWFLLMSCSCWINIFVAGLVIHPDSQSSWQPLPHVGRRGLLQSGVTTTTILAAGTNSKPAAALTASTTDNTHGCRSPASINSNVAIPVWPTWGGGRVVPVSLGGPLEDPFLLLAHHKHWFDPRDPLRGPFKAFGKALSLPYIDVEGFSMHPHRGFDIWTYVLDGSDGFCHKDSLTKDDDNPVIYRGGSVQWMRTGSGVMHEEFWETRNDRRTNIELFQLWVNLPAAQKFDPPVVKYVGLDTDTPWMETTLESGVHVRHLTNTLNAALFGGAGERKDDDASAVENNNDNSQELQVRSRPPIDLQHVKIPPGATWEASTPSDMSVAMYIREGTATLPAAEEPQRVKALQSVSFYGDGDRILIQNTERKKTLDLLLLMGQPLREPVAAGGPIVMNSQQELSDAYRQLQAGTFLDRKVALRTQLGSYSG